MYIYCYTKEYKLLTLSRDTTQHIRNRYFETLDGFRDFFVHTYASVRTIHVYHSALNDSDDI